jgi:hypothetical protein
LLFVKAIYPRGTSFGTRTRDHLLFVKAIYPRGSVDKWV